MWKSSISAFLAGLSLVCFVGPLRGDIQQGYLTNYVTYNLPDPRFHPVEVLPEQYSAPNIQRPPEYVAYEANPFSAYQSKYFRNQPIEYPSRAPESKYLNGEGYYDYSDLEPSIRDREYLKNDWRGSEQREDARSESNEKEIREKMNALDEVLSEDPKDRSSHVNEIDDKIMSEETKRVAREIRNKRPGFFWTLARITFETFNDTSSAIKQIGNLINDNIAPDSAIESSRSSSSLTVVNANATAGNMTTVNATESTTTTPTTTTRAPFVLTRSRLQTLIRRNILGLVKLFNIEWRDALNQSEDSTREFQNKLRNEVGVYLQDNPNAF